MRAFRIAHPKFADPLSGEGARLHGGRWNPVGVPMLYYALSRALAVLETRVHMPPSAVGMLWRLITIEIPGQNVIAANPTTLPADWNAQPAPDSAKMFGKAWIVAQQSLGLRVPSVIITEEENLLINPAHSALAAVTVISVENYRLDPRLGP